MQQTQTILTSDLILISEAEGWYDPLNPKSEFLYIMSPLNKKKTRSQE